MSVKKAFTYVCVLPFVNRPNINQEFASPNHILYEQ